MRRFSAALLLAATVTAAVFFVGLRLVLNNYGKPESDVYEIYNDPDMSVIAAKLLKEGVTSAKFITNLDDPQYFLASFNAGTWKAVEKIMIAERQKDDTIMLVWYMREPDDILEQLPDMAKQVVDGVITPDMDTVEQYKALHDWIILNCEYDKYFTAQFDGQSAWNVLNDRIALCEGYANAFKLLCDAARLPCVVVTGSSDGVPHGWNMVPHDGRWVYIDVTFDDPMINGKNDQTTLSKFNERYFMLTESQMNADHKLDIDFFLLAVKLYPDWQEW